MNHLKSTYREQSNMQVRRLHLEVALFATKQYQKTKNVLFAEYAKFFHDEAMNIRLAQTPE